MTNLTNKEAMDLVHQLRVDGNLIWNVGAKEILILPNDNVSIKNRLELNRALRKYGYLDADQCLEGESLGYFRMEAEEIMKDAGDWIEEFGSTVAKTQMSTARRTLANIKHLLDQHVGRMTYRDYLDKVEN